MELMRTEDPLWVRIGSQMHVIVDNSGSCVREHQAIVPYPENSGTPVRSL